MFPKQALRHGGARGGGSEAEREAGCGGHGDTWRACTPRRREAMHRDEEPGQEACRRGGCERTRGHFDEALSRQSRRRRRRGRGGYRLVLVLLLVLLFASSRRSAPPGHAPLYLAQAPPGDRRVGLGEPLRVELPDGKVLAVPARVHGLVRAVLHEDPVQQHPGRRGALQDDRGAAVDAFFVCNAERLGPRVVLRPEQVDRDRVVAWTALAPLPGLSVVEHVEAVGGGRVDGQRPVGFVGRRARFE